MKVENEKSENEKKVLQDSIRQIEQSLSSADGQPPSDASDYEPVVEHSEKRIADIAKSEDDAGKSYVERTGKGKASSDSRAPTEPRSEEVARLERALGNLARVRRRLPAQQFVTVMHQLQFPDIRRLIGVAMASQILKQPRGAMLRMLMFGLHLMTLTTP